MTGGNQANTNANKRGQTINTGGRFSGLFQISLQSSLIIGAKII